MNNLINWEKQYLNLEDQMRAMMKQTLRLLDENNFNVKKIIVESIEGRKFLTVLFKGDSPLFKFECYDNEENLLVQIDYTFRNSLDITDLKEISKILISIKDKDSNIDLFKEVLDINDL